MCIRLHRCKLCMAYCHEKVYFRYVFTFARGSMSWMSHVEKCVSLSTTKVEYIIATKACKKAIWLNWLVEDLEVTIGTPMLYSDSMSAIQLAQNPVFHAKTKHIKVKYDFIREVFKDKWLELAKVHMVDNPVELLTKSLPFERFACLREMMGIR